MAYQVLARKYRPSTLAEVVGQPTTVKALVNAFDRLQLHHAYLFSGTRGVGKTTLARIIAKCLNCQTGITSQPCGTCDNCVAIADGSFVDLIEVDGASRTKVEETRELLEDIAYLATMGAYKVYIIDEVHALSDSSFQTLLKSLEEPPEHVKFVLATTKPDKVPVTVRSRCIHFHLRNIAVEIIEQHLRMVLDQEGIGFDDASVHMLARMGQGSMRDALSLTDQATVLCGDRLNEEAVVNMLGCAPQDDVAVLLSALVARDRHATIAAVQEFAQRGTDFGEVLAGLESSVHALAMAKATNTSPGEALDALVGQCDATWLQQTYQVMIMGGRDLQYAPEPRIGFEMTMLRLLDFEPLDMLTDKQAPSSAKGNDASASTQKGSPESVNSVNDNHANVSVSGSVDRNDAAYARQERWQNKPSATQAKRVEREREEQKRRAQAEEAALKLFTADDELPYVKIFKETFNATLTPRLLDDSKSNDQSA